MNEWVAALVGLVSGFGFVMSLVLRAWGTALVWLLVVSIACAWGYDADQLKSARNLAKNPCWCEVLARPGIHTINNPDGTVATGFVWSGRVPDSLYIVGMRPVRAVTFVDHGIDTATVRFDQ